MTDYEPLDLSPYCNAGPSVLDSGDPRLGPQLLRGLPFHVAEDRNVAALPSGSPVRVDVDRPARHVIMAHRQLAAPAATSRAAAASWRSTVSTCKGAPTISVPIRQRFEIGVVPTVGGSYPSWPSLTADGL